jgi:hypothetical protein
MIYAKIIIMIVYMHFHILQCLWLFNAFFFDFEWLLAFYIIRYLNYFEKSSSHMMLLESLRGLWKTIVRIWWMVFQECCSMAFLPYAIGTLRPYLLLLSMRKMLWTYFLILLIDLIILCQFFNSVWKISCLCVWNANCVLVFFFFTLKCDILV